MPTKIRYSDEQVEQLLAELVSVLEKTSYSYRSFFDGVGEHGDKLNQYKVFSLLNEC